MRYLVGLLVPVALALTAIGCGKEIGDKCVISSDCSPSGDRQCDTSSKEGYCTIQGCDYGTCPEEATCVRFFTGSFGNKACDPFSEDNLSLQEPPAPPAECPPGAECRTDNCSLDELCGFAEHCVPRSSEKRFCMRTCDSDDDCRDGYECRDLAKMKAHGGEPVLEPGLEIDDSAPKFCATAPG